MSKDTKAASKTEKTTKSAEIIAFSFSRFLHLLVYPSELWVIKIVTTVPFFCLLYFVFSAATYNLLPNLFLILGQILGAYLSMSSTL